MRRSIPVLLAVLSAACGGEGSTAVAPARDTAAATPAPSAPAVASRAPTVAASTADASSDGLNEIPPAACELDHHVQFVNAFAQFASQRPRFAKDTGRAQLDGFDIALVDYRWQRESDGVALDVQITRSDTRLDVAATPVERDEDDAPVRILGPTRHYAFEHREGCWRYAGRR